MTVSIPLRPVATLVLVAALAACATEGEAPRSSAQVAAQGSTAVTYPGSAVRSGATIVTMADQYEHPRAGAMAATGASSWVPAAPPPAFVATGPAPPAGPPAPPPAAVANRQPAAAPTPAPVDAASIARPEAEAPTPAAPAPAATPALSAANLAKGRELFNDWSCGACHGLADAGSSGGVGPGLDNNGNLSRAFVIATIEEGRGPMPSFAGQMTQGEIETLTDYILQVARK